MDLCEGLSATLFCSKRQKFTIERDEMTITKLHFKTIEKQNSTFKALLLPFLATNRLAHNTIARDAHPFQSNQRTNPLSTSVYIRSKRQAKRLSMAKSRWINCFASLFGPKTPQKASNNTEKSDKSTQNRRFTGY